MIKDGSVLKPAVTSPSELSSISVRQYCKEELEKYPVILVPHYFERSLNASRALGDQAEQEVFDAIKLCGREIPEIRIIGFHGVRLMPASQGIIREVDQCLFITYKDRHYVVVNEVKCHAIIKKSGSARRQAIGQLKTFATMLEKELAVQIDKVQLHAVWPNMEPMEECETCSFSHPSLYEKPEACRPPGAQKRENPERPGFHVFKDKFEKGNFSNWMRQLVSDPESAIEEEDFNKILEFVSTHCVGALYDETVKSFCVLGDDQVKLVKRKEQPLDEPTVVYGLAGTGKTVSIMARIQANSGNLNESSKAIYVGFEDNAIEMVKRKLSACKVDLTHVTFANFSTTFPLRNRFKLCDISVKELVNNGYRYIYLDSAEDIGVDWVNNLVLKISQTASINRHDHHRRHSHHDPQKILCGDFWITVDPYQGLQDNHSLKKDASMQIHWQGNLPNMQVFEAGFKQGKFVKLRESFRMPLSLIKHIDTEKLLPTCDIPFARDVKSLGVVKENIEIPGKYNIKWLADHLAQQLHTKVMKRGIHPGHCAVLYDLGAEDNLFPNHEGGVSAFVEKVNCSLKAIPANGHADHMLQLTNKIKRSLLHSGVDSTPPSSLDSPVLVVEESNRAAAENTVTCKEERHAEVLR